MYINDSVPNLKGQSQMLNQPLPIAKKTTDLISKQVNYVAPSNAVLKTAANVIDKKYDLKADERKMIVKSNESNMLNNKYLLYGGIGLIAIGLLYYISQD